MKIESVRIENYRAIGSLEMALDPSLTVLYGENGCGKTSVLTAIAMTLGVGTDRDYDRLALDRQVGAAGDPVITLRGAHSPNPDFPEDRPLVSLYASRSPLPLENDTSIVLDGNPRRREWVPERQGRAFPPSRFYNVDRLVVSGLMGREVGSEPDYKQLFEWFYAMESKELRLQRDQSRDASLDTLSAVRAAICRMLRGVSAPRVDTSHPPRLVVTRRNGDTETTLAFEQLSDGYRGVLALAADIARHMPESESWPQPESVDVLDREIIVLVDEIELHLHPAWQQRILPDLTRTFPNAQFIVSTHSPQVLTSVQPQHVIELAFEGGRIVAGAPAAPMYGAEAGDVLSGVMGVERRPPNEFSERLTEYMRLIGDDRGETEPALQLRKRLEELSFHDPALQRADIEIRRRKMLRDMGES